MITEAGTVGVPRPLQVLERDADRCVPVHGRAAHHRLLRTLGEVKTRMKRNRRWPVVLGAVSVLLLGAGSWTVATATDDAQGGYQVSEQQIQVPESPGSPDRIELDTSAYLPQQQGDGPFPAVLLAHGFGGSKADLHGQAGELARAGYLVLTWSARGFGESQGRIGLNDPDREVADVSHLIDWLAKRPDVSLDAEGDPRVGMAGSSYGGAVTLMAAGVDDRIDAIAPQSTYHDLTEAIFPESSVDTDDEGVYKRMWTGLLFSAGGFGGFDAPTDSTAQQDDGAPEAAGSDTPAAQQPTPQPDVDADTLDTPVDLDQLGNSVRCGRYQPEICALYEQVAEQGTATPEIRELLTRHSPAASTADISAPTLVVQGMNDSLFPLDQADATVADLRANGVETSVMWTEGGHDGGDAEAPYIRERIQRWFDVHLAGADADPVPVFTVSRAGGLTAGGGTAEVRHAESDEYVPLADGDRERIELSNTPQPVSSPPGGSPAAISALPGLSALTGLGSLGGLGGFAFDMPGQTAFFESEPVGAAGVDVTGAPTVRVNVVGDGETVLFAKLYDVDYDGRATLPRQLVAPVRVQATPEGTEVPIQLPGVDHSFASGHKLRLAVSTSDMAYAVPAQSVTSVVSLADAGVEVPVRPDLVASAPPLPVWVWALPLAALAVAMGLLATARRAGSAGRPDPDLADVPLRIQGLTKRYANGYLAVNDLSFQVERGQVLGLLGPNGAGKTTTLRMLMGLVRPDAGEIRIFGHRVVPGTSALARLGSFVEGPGNLPHLSGRANLDLYWKAIGRPDTEAHMAEAVEIAALGSALDRPVRTYSQGMRQRLSIAQAMLGLPDLLVLDEPTNGLDPPQIREMRDVLVKYAATGRTVIVSSHLLAEVEQTCTHVVVMDQGRKVAAGRVEEIVGAGTAILVGTPAPEDALVRVRALDGVRAAEVGADGLLVHLEGITVAALVAELVGMGIAVDRVTPHRRLEDAFLSLIADAAAGERP
ncbi:ABC transporter ATP-binding protein [Nocardiopsis ansamitocini]|uniref:ABC transporter ATP-binding protein n=1 Tax=Nocardiopsis ansamitocini TaxID=1670832 RepID=A0A9W6P3X1_9ACTN|nr:ABC transporter ATP-binding protein [Nocardiopsis ansamitocini]